MNQDTKIILNSTQSDNLNTLKEEFAQKLVITKVEHNKNNMIMQMIQKHKKDLFTNLKKDRFPVPRSKSSIFNNKADSTNLTAETENITSLSNSPRSQILSALSLPVDLLYTPNQPVCSNSSQCIFESEICQEIPTKLQKSATTYIDKNNSKPTTKFSMSLTGKKNGMVLHTLATFQSNISGKWDKTQSEEFNRLIQQFLKWYELNQDEFKYCKGDSIAASILLLVGTKIGISKKDFRLALRSLEKELFNKIENIKKTACYQGLKSAFIALTK